MKQLHHRSGALILALILFICLFQGKNNTPVVSAKTTQELLNEAQQEKDEIEGTIEETQEQIDGLNGEKNTLQGRLNELTTQLSEVSEHLAELEAEILVKEDEIATTRAALAEAEEQRDTQYANMMSRIQFIYEQSQTLYLEMIFSARSIADLLTSTEYISQMEDYDRRMLIQYEDTCTEISNTEATLVTEAEELAALKEEAEAEKARVDELIASTSNYIGIYADQIEAAEEAAELYEQQLHEQEQEIQALQKKLEEERRLAALAANATVRDLSSVTFAEGDRYLLANLIYCEAGGEPYEGQLAVGAVVINRLLNGAFPDTIVGVIYQRNQFSPAASGRLALALAQNKATSRCYQAADEAMAGKTNVAGCLFFRTPIAAVTPTYVIGGHYFY